MYVPHIGRQPRKSASSRARRCARQLVPLPWYAQWHHYPHMLYAWPRQAMSPLIVCGLWLPDALCRLAVLHQYGYVHVVSLLSTAPVHAIVRADHDVETHSFQLGRCYVFGDAGSWIRGSSCFAVAIRPHDGAVGYRAPPTLHSNVARARSRPRRSTESRCAASPFCTNPPSDWCMAARDAGSSSWTRSIEFAFTRPSRLAISGDRRYRRRRRRRAHTVRRSNARMIRCRPTFAGQQMRGRTS